MSRPTVGPLSTAIAMHGAVPLPIFSENISEYKNRPAVLAGQYTLKHRNRDKNVKVSGADYKTLPP